MALRRAHSGTEPTGTAARILDAAEEVFAERGYEGTSTREIARRAVIPFGALHYHWGSKRVLWQAVCERIIERSRETLLRNLRFGTTLAEILDPIVDAFVDMLVANRNHTRLVCRTFLDDPRDPYVKRLMNELFGLGLETLLRTAPRPVPDPALAIYVMSVAFVAAVTNEVGQDQVLGASVFHSAEARERLRRELRRLAYAAFGLEEGERR